MHGISTINIELTSRCQKDCHMCGRREEERKDPHYDRKQGDMDYRIVIELARQISPGTVVQLHWNGEPTLYKNLADAAKAFRRAGCYVCMDTNGLKIDRKMIENFHSVTVSIIESDSEENYSAQFRNIVALIAMPGGPMINMRILGKVPSNFLRLANQHRIKMINRIFHAPEMSRAYVKPVTLPEIGVCLDLLHHPAIDRLGNVFPCVRYNPRGLNVLGNVMETPLYRILSGAHRTKMIEHHWMGARGKIDLCCECDYWGIPRG